MRSLNGIVTSIKVLKMSERPLVYFKLNDKSCLIARRSLSFLADVENGMRIVAGGHYNKRQQFVIEKYCVIGQSRIIIEMDKIEREKLII